MKDNQIIPVNHKLWAKQKTESSNPLKSKLLHGSIDLIEDENDNQSACREIIEQALEARLYTVAFRAFKAFSPNSEFDMCVSISHLFEKPEYWDSITQDITAYCEKRALNSKECRSGFSFGGHFCDQRSNALAKIGKYHYFCGRQNQAEILWNAAGERRDVDEVIQTMCEMIASKSTNNIDFAIALLDKIKTKSIKAKAMANLSKFV